MTTDKSAAMIAGRYDEHRKLPKAIKLRGDRMMVRLNAAVLVLTLAAALPSAVAKERINLVDFGRVVELPNVPSQPTTDEQALPQGPEGWEPVLEPDGEYTIGVEWDEPRDISEVNIEFRHAIANREQIRVQYWKSQAPQGKQGTRAAGKPSAGKWMTPKTEWWAGDRDVSFAFGPQDIETPNGSKRGPVYRRTTRIRFLCGKADDLPAVRFLRAYGPGKVVTETFELRFDGKGRITPPVMVDIYNGYILSSDGGDNLQSTVIHEGPGSLQIRYFRGDTTSPNRTKVTIHPVDKPKEIVSFLPAAVAAKRGTGSGRGVGQLRIPDSGIVVESRGPRSSTTAPAGIGK